MAHVNDKLQVQKLETWFDPLEMFRQITPNGIVNKEISGHKVELDGTEPAEKEVPSRQAREEQAPLSAISSSTVNGEETRRMEPAKISDPTVGATPGQRPDGIDRHLAKTADDVHPHPKDAEMAVRPVAGQSVAAPADSEETKATHEEMSKATSAECPFLMNRE